MHKHTVPRQWEQWDVQQNNCEIEVRQHSLWSLSSSFVRDAVPLPSHSALVRRSSAWLHIRYLQKYDDILCQTLTPAVVTVSNWACPVMHLIRIRLFLHNH